MTRGVSTDGSGTLTPEVGSIAIPRADISVDSAPEGAPCVLPPDISAAVQSDDARPLRRRPTWLNPTGMTADAPRIMVVDDEQTIVDLVTGYLVREGWRVESTTDGLEALAAIETRKPDVVVLDVMLPGLDGLEVCRRLRTFTDAYVIMLTARAEEIDRIVGLSVGADDYLTKPFSPRELVARIKALLRRPRGGPARAAMGGRGLDVQLGRRRVTVDGRAIDLTNTEFELLAGLVRDPSTVVTRQQLLDRVWGADYFGDDHVIDVHIGNLRRKLGDDPERPRWIETVRGIGFRFLGEDE